MAVKSYKAGDCENRKLHGGVSCGPEDSCVAGGWLRPTHPPLAPPAHDDLLRTSIWMMHMEDAHLAHLHLVHAIHEGAPCACCQSRFMSKNNGKSKLPRNGPSEVGNRNPESIWYQFFETKLLESTTSTPEASFEQIQKIKN